MKYFLHLAHKYIYRAIEPAFLRVTISNWVRIQNREEREPVRIEDLIIEFQADERG